MNKPHLDEFYQNLYQDSIVGFDSDVNVSFSDSLRNEIASYLEEDGDLSDVIWTEYNQKDMEFSGYSFDSERGLLTLISDHFFNSERIETLTKDNYERDFKKLRNFFIEATNENNHLYKDMAPGDPASGTAKIILNYWREKKIKRIVFLLITNGILTRNTSSIPSDTIREIHCDYHVYDLQQMYQTVIESQSVQIEINMEDYDVDEGLPCIKAISDQENRLDSYLVVMPGIVIAKIYDKYGQKLLEQNVRTFLQLKGKTNKNMLATIKTQPERFFIYNNGLTCTASSIRLKEDSNICKIHGLEGLQIVNGGQTSSVIYRAYSEGLDLSKIFVQMKLSIIKNSESYDAIVGSIARYANTQNPVKESDFFSNSPFNKGFYDAAKNNWAPASKGRQYKTLWFYERTRGLYLNEKTKYVREGKEKEFIRKYPKEQLIDKNVLAKTSMIFTDRPYASGNQTVAFSFFSSDVAKLSDGNPDFAVTPKYFMNTIAQIILVNDTEKIILSRPWAKEMRSIRTYIKAYSVALLNKYVKDNKCELKLQDIWDRQMISDDLSSAIGICIDAIHKELTKNNENTDLREKLRSSSTWEKLKNTEISIPREILDSICISAEQEKQSAKKDKSDSALLSDAKKLEAIIGLSQADWYALYKFLNNNPGLCAAFSLVDKKMRFSGFYPTKKSEINGLYDAITLGKQYGVLKP